MTGERIALAVGRPQWLVIVSTRLSRKNLAKLDDCEITANRNGFSNNPKADAAARFAVKISARARPCE